MPDLNISNNHLKLIKFAIDRFSKKEAAQRLGISEKTLYLKIKKYQL